MRDSEPVGRQFYWTIIGPEKRFRIVGVVGDSIDTLLDDAASPAVYLPVGFSQGMDLLVRTNRPGPGDNRRREYAIRVALGGTERQITWMRLRKTLETVAYGLLCGVLASAALGRVAQSMLFRVPAIDPLMMAAACTVLFVAAFAASYSSIRDTMRLDPGELLRAS